MTIGMNETLNKLSGVDKEKFAKKDEFTTQDFSTISKQFSNIFNSQFSAQFKSQFDYKQVFANNSGTKDFMSNTASKMTDEKYYSQSYKSNDEHLKATSSEQNTNKSEANTAKKPEETKKPEEAKKPEEVVKTVEVVDTAAVEAQALAMVANTQKVQPENTKEHSKTEKEAKHTEKAEKAEATDKTKTLEVSIKATEVDALKALVVDGAATPAVDVDLKDVKIEKIKVKAKTQTVGQDKEKVKPEAEVKEKPETEAKEQVQNKVSLERLTANVVSENAEATSELDKLLNKDIIKKADTSAKKAATSVDNADSKVQAESKNMNNQNFGQGFGQSFGQAHQDAQAQLKANFSPSSLTVDTSLHKNHIQPQAQMNGFGPLNQANNMLERNIFDQVMKNIQGNISAQKSEVSMILQPESLGKVTLNIMNEKGVVSAEFKAETKEAVAALSKNIEDLKETLKQQGVICANLVVKLEESNSSENNMQFAQEQNAKDFSQENQQTSDNGSSENQSNNETFKSEFNQDIQVEQEQPNQTADDQGVVDYRV